MTIRLCIAGATGWARSALAGAVAELSVVLLQKFAPR